MIEEIITTYLIPALITALTGFIAYVGNRLKQIYNDKVKNEMIRAIVADVVEYVERTMKSAENADKYSRALELASEWITSKGFEISATELQLLIEGAVNKLPKTNKEEE